MILTKDLKIYRFTIYTTFSIFFLIYLFPIDFMMPSSGLDPSWFYVMDYAYNKDLLFPNELLFTYGPFGNFHYPAVMYNKEILFLHYLFPIFFTLLVVISLVKILRKQNLFILIISLTGILVALTFTWRADLEATNIFWFLLQFLLIFLVFNHQSKSDVLFIYLLVVSIAFSGLVKFSYVPSAVLIILLTDIFLYLAFKKIFAFSIVYGVSFIFFYLLAEQNLGDIGSFILGSWQVASGFSGSIG